jgi:small subunit ribosomal protein S6
MAFYEHVVISRQDISPQQAEALNDTLKALIEEGGGTVAKIEYWGLRNLTYRVKKNRKGHYSLLGIDAPAAAVKEMERQLSINEDVLRFMTVRVEELVMELSPVLARRDRGDRPEGPPRHRLVELGQRARFVCLATRCSRRPSLGTRDDATHQSYRPRSPGHLRAACRQFVPHQ